MDDRESRATYSLSSLAALVGIFIAMAIGFAAGKGNPFLANIFAIAEFLPFFAFCRLLRIEFGPTGLTKHQLTAHLSICLAVGLAGGVPFALMYEISPDPTIHNIIGLSCAVGCGICIALLSGRPIYLCGALFTIPRGLCGIVLPKHDWVPDFIPWYGWVCSSFFFCTSFVRYKKDQSTLGMLAVAVASSIPYGYNVARNRAMSNFFLNLAVAYAYAQILWRRWGRRLPPGLAGCKFVTLEYLRRVAASGEGIRRCQDLPEDAFGHPGKARFVISVSHRWLDHYSCDLKTEDFPEGMRLHTMVEKLDEYFSIRGIGKGHGIRNRLTRLAMALTGGCDVVLFFDFMSLPQESLADDGTIQTRTPHEQLLFSRCLPNMGALYSMLPVLVCGDVPEGTHAYQDSGWCFAEIATAWMGNQLQLYSADCPTAAWFRRASCGSREEVPSKFADALDQELKTKHFLRDEDREEVRSILRGFHAKSCLVQAIREKSSEGLRDVLASFPFRTAGLLDQAVDSDLNTPLHLAVASNFPEGVEMLLESGARRDLRNLRGDLPVDFFMLPRLSRAAFTCRKHVILKNLGGRLEAHRRHSSGEPRGKERRSRSSSSENEESSDCQTSSNSNSNSNGRIQSQFDVADWDDASPKLEHIFIRIDQESPSQSENPARTHGFDSSTNSFWVSQSDQSWRFDLEQPNPTSAVEFSSPRGATDVPGVTLPPNNSFFRAVEVSHPHIALQAEGPPLAASALGPPPLLHPAPPGLAATCPEKSVSTSSTSASVDERRPTHPSSASVAIQARFGLRTPRIASSSTTTSSFEATTPTWTLDAVSSIEGDPLRDSL